MEAPLRRYVHGLAERLCCTVAELGERLDVAELRDWIAYDRIQQRAAPDKDL